MKCEKNKVGQDVVRAEVEVDGQHGPIVRVIHGDIIAAVYLYDETGVVTTPEGQYGVEVLGPWREFKRALRGDS